MKRNNRSRSGSNRRMSFGRNTNNGQSQPYDQRSRANALKNIERYTNLAKDALSGGDIVLAENYFQYADHYQRVANANIPKERPEYRREEQPAFEEEKETSTETAGSENETENDTPEQPRQQPRHQQGQQQSYQQHRQRRQYRDKDDQEAVHTRQQPATNDVKEANVHYLQEKPAREERPAHARRPQYARENTREQAPVSEEKIQAAFLAAPMSKPTVTAEKKQAAPVASVATEEATTEKTAVKRRGRPRKAEAVVEVAE